MDANPHMPVCGRGDRAIACHLDEFSEERSIQAT
jgi:hypothetical protein